MVEMAQTEPVIEGLPVVELQVLQLQVETQQHQPPELEVA
jgi:hypothetical protein